LQSALEGMAAAAAVVVVVLVGKTILALRQEEVIL